MIRWIFRGFVILLALLGLGVMVGWMAGGFSPKIDTKGTSVRIESVTPQTLTEVVSAPGELQPLTKVSLSARTSARILELPYEEGQQVTKGDPTANPPIPPSVLVRLDDSDLRALLDAAEARRDGQEVELAVEEARLNSQNAQIDVQRIELADAKRELRRNLKLVETKDVSVQAVDQAQAKVDQLEARIIAAEKALEADRSRLEVTRYNIVAANAEIARARDQLSYTTIVSPIDGVVTKVNAKVGEVVVTGTMNNPGTVIVEVADLSKMKAIVRLDQSNIFQVKEGLKARVRLQAFEDELFLGQVVTVGLDVETETRNQRSNAGEYYAAEILLDNPGRRLPAGLKADAEIEILTHQDVLKVPSQAVVGLAVEELPEAQRTLPEVDQEMSVTPVVYVMENGKAQSRPVKTGPSDLTHTIIRSGLKEGDKVIVGPYKALLTIKNDTVVSEITPTTQPTTSSSPTASTQPAAATSQTGTAK